MSRFQVSPARTPSTRVATRFLDEHPAIVKAFLSATRPDLRGLFALGSLNEVLREKGLPSVVDGGGR